MDATIKSSSGKSINISLSFRELTIQERRKAGLRGLGIGWALALGFLPLPPIHWILTPFFFFFGFYWGWKKYKEHTYLQPFAFPCLECGGQVDVKAHDAKNNQALTCPHCRYMLRLTW